MATRWRVLLVLLGVALGLWGIAEAAVFRVGAVGHPDSCGWVLDPSSATERSPDLDVEEPDPEMRRMQEQAEAQCRGPMRLARVKAGASVLACVGLVALGIRRP